jgi:hypothetical protein
MAATTEDILSRLTELAEYSGKSFERLEIDVQDLKQNRYKPYITSMGAFLVVVMGVMSYVYTLETRLSAVLFSLNARVAVADERMMVLSDRLGVRTEGMVERWSNHASDHARMQDSLRLIVEHMLEEPPHEFED